MRLNRKILVAVLVLIACGTFVSRSLGQQPSAQRTQPPAIISYNGDMASILTHLPGIYGATIGLEVDTQQPSSEVGFYLRDPSLTDVLNAIVQSAPRYRWRENGEFVEVLPSAGSSALLDTVISKFRVDDVDEAVAINQLVNLPEVQASMRMMSLSRRDLGDLSKGKGRKFSFSLESVTMRQALNAIAKGSGARFWIFRRDRGGFFSISSSPM